MTATCVGKVWDLPMPPLAKIVLLNVADHAWKDGTNAFPGVKRIARETNVSVNTVRAKLRDLERYGFIEKTDFPAEFEGRIPANRRPQCYRLRLTEDGLRCRGAWPGFESDDADQACARGSNMTPCPGGQKRAPGGQMGTVRGANEGPQGSSSFAPKPSENLQEPSGQNPGADGAAPDGAPSAPAFEADDVGDRPRTLIARWRALMPWIEKRFGKGVWDAWFEDVIPSALSDEALILEVPTAFRRDYFDQHFTRHVHEHLGVSVQVRVTERARARAHRRKAAAQ